MLAEREIPREVGMELKRGERRRLPARRGGYNQKVRIGNMVFHFRTSEYEDGTLGEIWLDCSKAGSSLRALLNAFCITFSLSLQYGTPLKVLLEQFKDFGFLPDGPLDGDPRFSQAKSILDYVARELEMTYLTPSDSSDLSDNKKQEE